MTCQFNSMFIQKVSKVNAAKVIIFEGFFKKKNGSNEGVSLICF